MDASMVHYHCQRCSKSYRADFNYSPSFCCHSASYELLTSKDCPVDPDRQLLHLARNLEYEVRTLWFGTPRFVVIPVNINLFSHQVMNNSYFVTVDYVVPSSRNEVEIQQSLVGNAKNALFKDCVGRSKWHRPVPRKYSLRSQRTMSTRSCSELDRSHHWWIRLENQCIKRDQYILDASWRPSSRWSKGYMSNIFRTSTTDLWFERNILECTLAIRDWRATPKRFALLERFVRTRFHWCTASAIHQIISHLWTQC